MFLTTSAAQKRGNPGLLGLFTKNIDKHYLYVKIEKCDLDLFRIKGIELSSQGFGKYLIKHDDAMFEMNSKGLFYKQKRILVADFFKIISKPVIDDDFKRLNAQVCINSNPGDSAAVAEFKSKVSHLISQHTIKWVFDHVLSTSKVFIDCDSRLVIQAVALDPARIGFPDCYKIRSRRFESFTSSETEETREHIPIIIGKVDTPHIVVMTIADALAAIECFIRARIQPPTIAIVTDSWLEARKDDRAWGCQLHLQHGGHRLDQFYKHSPTTTLNGWASHERSFVAAACDFLRLSQTKKDDGKAGSSTQSPGMRP